MKTTHQLTHPETYINSNIAISLEKTPVSETKGSKAWLCRQSISVRFHEIDDAYNIRVASITLNGKTLIAVSENFCQYDGQGWHYEPGIHSTGISIEEFYDPCPQFSFTPSAHYLFLQICQVVFKEFSEWIKDDPDKTPAMIRLSSAQGDSTG